MQANPLFVSPRLVTAAMGASRRKIVLAAGPGLAGREGPLLVARRP